MKLKFELFLAGLIILLFIGAFFFVVHEPEMAPPISEPQAEEKKNLPTLKHALPNAAPAKPVIATSKTIPEAETVSEKPEKPKQTIPAEADFGVEGAAFALSSGLPLEGCQVSFKGGNLVTGSSGEFHLWLTGEVGRLSFSCAGYKTLEIPQFDVRAGDGLARFDVYLAAAEEPGPGRIEINGVNGRVYSRESGAPLAGARITIGARRTVTDDAGFFELWGNNSGLVTMTVAAPGFISEMLSGIDFENRSNPFFFEVSLQPNRPGSKGRLALVGVGARLVKSEAGYEIADVLNDSPAALEGLQAGDRLVAVDSLAVDDFSLTEVVELIRGQAGIPVTLMIERDGDFLEFICLRQRVVY